MNISMISNQYCMTATVYGVLISVSSPTLEGVKSQFEHELYMLEVCFEADELLSSKPVFDSEYLGFLSQVAKAEAQWNFEFLLELELISVCFEEMSIGSRSASWSDIASWVEKYSSFNMDVIQDIINSLIEQEQAA
jgi:hypothetical protein